MLFAIYKEDVAGRRYHSRAKILLSTFSIDRFVQTSKFSSFKIVVGYELLVSLLCNACILSCLHLTFTYSISRWYFSSLFCYLLLTGIEVENLSVIVPESSISAKSTFIYSEEVANFWLIIRDRVYYLAIFITPKLSILAVLILYILIIVS